MTLSPCARVPSPELASHGPPLSASLHLHMTPTFCFISHFSLHGSYLPRQICTLYTSSSAVAPASPFSPRPHATLSVLRALRKPPALTSSAFFTALSATHSSFPLTAVCVILIARSLCAPCLRRRSCHIRSHGCCHRRPYAQGGFSERHDPANRESAHPPTIWLLNLVQHCLRHPRGYTFMSWKSLSPPQWPAQMIGSVLCITLTSQCSYLTEKYFSLLTFSYYYYVLSRSLLYIFHT